MATHLLNITMSTSMQNDIPFTKLFNKPPTYTHLHIIGCLYYPYIPTPHKLAPRSTQCVFLGYPSHHHINLCLDLSSCKISISHHVVFNESYFPYRSITPDQRPSYSFPYYYYDHLLICRSFFKTPSTIVSFFGTTHSYNTESTPSPRYDHSHDPYIPLASPTDSPDPPTPPYLSHSMVTRLHHDITKPISRIKLLVSTDSPIPKVHMHAFHDPNWTIAMQDKFNALISIGSWDFLPRPNGANVVSFMWLFNKKYKANGSFDRYKTRLVANNKSERPGIDCDGTFSPIVKLDTIRSILNITVSRQWPIHQLDVKNAFLHDNLHETGYMHQPPGFRDPNHSTSFVF